MTLFILHVGWEVTTEIFHHLMDGVEPKHLEAATPAALNVSEVRDVVEALDTRWIPRRSSRAQPED